MSDELLPCPFCGGEAEVKNNHRFRGVFVWVGCEDCHIGTETYSMDALGMAAKLWNTRTAKVGAWECRKIEEVSDEM